MRCTAGEEAEYRLVDRAGVLLLHRVRGAQDLDALGGAALSRHELGRSRDTTHVALAQWREAGTEQLRAQCVQVLAGLLLAHLGKPLVGALAEHAVAECLQRLLVVAAP